MRHMTADVQEHWFHGRRLAYRDVGEGPVVLLVHGITNSARSWEPVTERLAAAGHRVLAPDLPGHGESDRFRGDHSLGAHASTLRDLLLALDVERATVVGHSLGGGIVLQFAYGWPSAIERIVLVDSGGLGRDVSLLIRAAALPFAEHVIGLGASGPVARAAEAVGSALSRVGVRAAPDKAELVAGVASLGDRRRREAFVRTARSVVSPAGQRVNATDRLYLAEDIPTLIVWGDRDRIIPVGHAHDAHAAMPGSRLEIFGGSGHYPQLTDPDRFSALMADFISSTEPATFDPARMRERVLGRRSALAAEQARPDREPTTASQQEE
jgi:pimeloyl-ACP methyl ester carboxylesterase